jgi:acetyl esterase/lipase
MRKTILSLLLLGSFSQAQTRYVDEVFSTVTTTSGVTFSTNIPTVKVTNLFGNRIANEESYGQVTTTLKMDIYQPSGDTNTSRPVVIFCFGGGFVNGSRTEASMVKLCQAFAKRGYVAASIDYRLGMNLSDEQLSKRAVYRGIQDGRSAIRFFRRNAATYKVNANKIFISGHSAGGFVALHNIYLDNDSERPASTRLYNGRPDLGGLDAIGDNKTFSNGATVSGKANGAVSFAGALGEVSYIQSSTDTPSALFHSSDDGTVPYNSGEPFSSLNWLPGFNLPDVYGGNAINNRANQVGMTREFFPYTNRGHNVHFTNNNLYSDIAPKAALFLYNKFLAPGVARISGNMIICGKGSVETYSLEDFSAYTEWEVKGGKILNQDNNAITVAWNNDNDIKEIEVTNYSGVLAKGEKQYFSISNNTAPFLVSDIVLNDNEILDPNTYFKDLENQTITFRAIDNQGNSWEINSISSTNDIVYVEAKDAMGCAILARVNVKSGTDSITAGPNPFTNSFVITLPKALTENANLEIFDVQGKAVLNKIIQKDTQTAEVNELIANGVYVMRLSNSQIQFEQKIVKQ